MRLKYCVLVSACLLMCVIALTSVGCSHDQQTTEENLETEELSAENAPAEDDSEPWDGDYELDADDIARERKSKKGSQGVIESRKGATVEEKIAPEEKRTPAPSDEDEKVVKKTASSKVSQSKDTQQQYIQRFSKVAHDMSVRSGIPDYVLMAWAIAWSETGAASYTEKTKNHFGLLCEYPSSNCIGISEGIGVVNFNTAWESWKAAQKILAEPAKKAKCGKEAKCWAKLIYKSPQIVSPKRLKLKKQLTVDEFAELIRDLQ
jgi:hypothetical protein